MHRRRLLAVCGAGLAGVAGCTGDSGEADPPRTDPTADRTDPTTGSTTPPSDLAVTRTRVLPALVAMNTPDSATVYGESGERYVLATVDATDATDPPARGAFSLTAGDRSHEPTVAVGYGEGLTYRHFLGEGIYTAETPAGDIPFAVPSGAADPVTLSWPGGETALDGVGEALARPTPSVSVESFEASVEDGAVTLSVTVHNAGDARGWFVGAVNRRGPSVAVVPVTGVAVAAAPGETATWTREDDGLYGSSGTAEYTLRTGEDDHEASVEVG